MKVCKLCNIEKHKKEFLPSGSTRDGLSKVCILCKATEKGLSVEDFWWNRLIRNDAGTNSKRKAYNRKHAKLARLKYPEKQKVYSAKWIQENPEIAAESRKKRRDLKKIYDFKWSATLEHEIRQFFSYCIICGKDENENGKRLDVDHVYPLSKGHGLEPGNAVVLCEVCNRQKSDKDLDNLPDGWKDWILWSAERFLTYCNLR